MQALRYASTISQEQKLPRKPRRRMLPARVLLVPLVEGLLGLLHGLVDTKEVLVAEGVDGLGLVELLCGAPAVLEPYPQDLSSNYQLSDSAEEHCPCPTFHHTQHCDNRHRLPRLALPIELGRDLGQVGQHLLVQGRHRSIRILRHHLEDLLDDVRLTAGMNDDKSLQHNAVQLNSNCATQRAFVLPFTSFWERKKALRSWTFFSLASRAS